jgi:hypothetical protein
MTDNIEVFPGAHRSYDEDRDWMVPNEGRPYNANVVTFSPKLLQCSVCGQRTHRASQCPLRPRKVAALEPQCAND